MSKQLNLNSDTPKKTRKKRVYKTKGETVKAGDLVEKITTATGIKKAVEVFSLITGADCNCEARKEKLNNIPLFKRGRLKAKCITQDQYYQIKEVLIVKNNSLTREQSIKIAEFYSTVFSTRYNVWCLNCAEIWKSKMRDLQGVVDFYAEELGE